MIRYIWYCIALVGLLSGCKKDSPIPNTPPLTRLFVSYIGLAGENRLQSVVRLNWSGEDKDGVVKGFEYAINNGAWQFTTAVDTTFRFDISPGADTTDIYFCVRAIDNLGVRDPEPACLKVPIRNTPPIAVLDSLVAPPDTFLSVLTYRLLAQDVDGNETIDTLYLKINDGEWLPLRSPCTVPGCEIAPVITIVPTNPTQAGVTDADVFIDGRDVPNSRRLKGLVIEGNNTLYFKSKDKGGLFSAVDSAKATYLLRKRSDLLVLDSWKSPMPNLDPLRPIAKYAPILNQTFGGYDYLDLIQNKNQPDLPNITFKYLFRLHKSVFWFAQQLADQIIYIETGQGVIQDYLKNNGRILFSVPLLATQNPTNSVFFDIAPFDSLAFAVNNGTPVGAGMDASESLQAVQAGYPNMSLDPNVASGGLSGVCPIYPKAGADILYKASALRVGANPWTKTTDVIARGRINVAGTARTNMIFSVIPLHRLNNLDAFFAQVKQEFEW